MLLRHINYFLAVAEHGGFTRAAAALYVSQPALSQQIRQLEASLGTPLFDRSGRATRLTDAGEAYLGYARRALQDLEAGRRALHDVQDLSRGTLRLGLAPTFASYLVGPLAEAFHRRHPRIALTVREMPQERMEDQLDDNRLDVGIAFDAPRSPDIEAETLLTETLALVVGKAHPLARRRSVRLPALADESLVLLSGEFETRGQIDRRCREHGIRPRVSIEADSVGAVVEIVRRTALSSLLPAAIAAQRDDIFALSLTPGLLERTAILLQRKNGYRSAAARAFVAVALETYRGGRKRRPASHSISE
ncbi:transcriptional regulator [Frateuria sp. Soil773]|uniref:transcriptional regulator CynR n=1 Tax=Frateuria sp. Soil773 TaxID=1736407 RepID=UPI0006F7C187|nr:transcriptional regulator CynR [Frateuria sp. Soil773]KRE89328.1 transcriptional regulator [Frateuria sp. Soil773]